MTNNDVYLVPQGGKFHGHRSVVGDIVVISDPGDRVGRSAYSAICHCSCRCVSSRCSMIISIVNGDP